MRICTQHTHTHTHTHKHTHTHTHLLPHITLSSLTCPQGLGIMGDPKMTIFAFESTEKEVDLNAVADVMEKSGWKMERQLTSIHCTILPHHSMRRSAQLLDDLKKAVQTVRVGVWSQTGGCQGGCLVSNRRLSG